MSCMSRARIVVGQGRRIRGNTCSARWSGDRRQVRRRESERAFRCRPRASASVCAGKRVHQIEIEVVKVRVRDVDCAPRFVVVVDAARAPSGARRLKLWMPIDSRLTPASRKRAEFLCFERAGIRFERDFGVESTAAHARGLPPASARCRPPTTSSACRRQRRSCRSCAPRSAAARLRGRQSAHRRSASPATRRALHAN